MSGRYKVRCADEGVFVYDGTTGGDVDGPMSWDSATRDAAARNSETPPPAAPSCDCPAERYRHALAQIHRHSPCPIAQRYVDAALFAAARVRGDGNAL